MTSISSMISSADVVTPPPVGAATTHRMDTMGGPMCLAIVPILILLLLGRRHSTIARHLDHLTAGRHRPPAARGRAPPPHLTPSLSRLCVLRT
ncbi:MAG: hypothetical protein ABI083_17715 [Lapillicoccus sp.]